MNSVTLRVVRIRKDTNIKRFTVKIAIVTSKSASRLFLKMKLFFNAEVFGHHQTFLLLKTVGFYLCCDFAASIFYPSLGWIINHNIPECEPKGAAEFIIRFFYVCFLFGWLVGRVGGMAWGFGGVALFSFVWDLLFCFFLNLDIKLMLSFSQTSHCDN